MHTVQRAQGFDWSIHNKHNLALPSLAQIQDGVIYKPVVCCRTSTYISSITQGQSSYLAGLEHFTLIINAHIKIWYPKSLLADHRYKSQNKAYCIAFHNSVWKPITMAVGYLPFGLGSCSHRHSNVTGLHSDCKVHHEPSFASVYVVQRTVRVPVFKKWPKYSVSCPVLYKSQCQHNGSAMVRKLVGVAKVPHYT